MVHIERCDPHSHTLVTHIDTVCCKVRSQVPVKDGGPNCWAHHLSQTLTIAGQEDHVGHTSNTRFWSTLSPLGRMSFQCDVLCSYFQPIEIRPMIQKEIFLGVVQEIRPTSGPLLSSLSFFFFALTKSPEHNTTTNFKGRVSVFPQTV